MLGMAWALEFALLAYTPSLRPIGRNCYGLIDLAYLESSLDDR